MRMQTEASVTDADVALFVFDRARASRRWTRKSPAGCARRTCR
jgi:hypothetical protein